MVRSLLVTVLLGLVSAGSDAASFLPLGNLPGGTASYALGVSGDGAVVVGYGNTGWENQAFVWTGSAGMVGLDSLNGGRAVVATAVSMDGSVIVGGGTGASGTESLRWNRADGVIGVAVAPYSPNAARGVSGDGSVVVGQTAGNAQAWLWTSSDGGRALDPTSITANAVSADGSVVVGERVTNDGSEPFLWTEEEGVLGLGRLPSVSPGGPAPAKAISADGSVVVGLSEGQAFRWTSVGGMVGLGFLSADRTYSHANGVSADGSVIVGLSYVDTYGPYEAFLWTPDNGMQRLFDVLVANGATIASGWKLDEATAVSADGKWVVGRASGPSGHSQAFIANIEPAIVPIPAATWLLGSALGMMGVMRRKLSNQALQPDRTREPASVGFLFFASRKPGDFVGI